MALALTTTFTPSAYCTQDVYRYNTSCSYDGSTTVGAYDCQYYHLGPATSSSDCLPSSWSQALTSYYASGICPTGYTEAQKSQVLDSTGAVSLRAVCCPSGYVYETGSEYPWLSTDLCSSHMPKTETMTFTYSLQGQGWATVTTYDYRDYKAFGIPIEYASTSSALTSAPTVTTMPTSTSTAGSSRGSSGLSSGAKAGIGVGVAIGGILILGAIAAFVVTRRRRAAAARAGASSSAYTQAPTSPPGGESYGGSSAPRYSTSTPGYTVSEMAQPDHAPLAGGGTVSSLNKTGKPDANIAYELPVIREPIAELPANN